MEKQINENTPISEMTAGQLAEFLRSAGARPAEEAAAPERRYVYGLRGIMELFGVSNVTAQRYKAGIIKDAVKQYGRKIIVDADRALELFNSAQEQK